MSLSEKHFVEYMTVRLVPDFLPAGSYEGAWALSSGKLMFLSEQQFVEHMTVRLLPEFLHSAREHLHVLRYQDD